MAVREMTIHVKRWQGGQHPTRSAITRLMQQQGLRPYEWVSKPNQRYAVSSHGYDKVLYVLNGSLEIHLPDINQRVVLRTGDQVDIPAGMRHGMISGASGAVCQEAALSRSQRRASR